MTSTIDKSNLDTNQMGIILEDWKMAKDRIDNFDKAILSIRLTGIPIVLVIIGIGVAIIDKTKEITIPILNCNGAVIPFVVAFLYTFSLLLLDGVHYSLLLKAVAHAQEIEQLSQFKDLLGITNKLTSKKLTFWHTVSLALIYGTILLLSLALIWLFWNGEIIGVVKSNETIKNMVVGLIP